MKNDLVSIIVPCYNQASYITETLDSVLNQSYTNWECIIVNDGSSDNSQEVIEDYIKGQSKFTLISQKNSGVAAARNNAIKKSNGVYILPLDADDVISANYLKLAVKTFYEFPNCKVVYGKAHLIGTINEYWPLPPYDYERFIIVNCIFNSAFFKRTDFDKTKGYDEKLIYGYEDWDLLLQLISKDDEILRLEEVVYFYRQHERSRNDFNKNEKELDFTLKYLFKKHKRHYKSNIFLGLPYELFVDKTYTYGQLDEIKNSNKLLRKFYWKKFKRRYLKFNNKK